LTVKVAVKYCGGCNPRYDRKGLVAGLLAEFPCLEAVSANSPDARFGLVVGGCTRGCAAKAEVPGVKFVVCDQSQYPALREEVARALAGLAKG